MGLTKSHWTIEKYHTKLLRYIPSHFISQIVDVFPPSYPIVYPYVGFLQGVIIPNHLFDLRISMKYTQPMETPICICIPSIPLPLFPAGSATVPLEPLGGTGRGSVCRCHPQPLGPLGHRNNHGWLALWSQEILGLSIQLGISSYQLTNSQFSGAGIPPTRW